MVRKSILEIRGRWRGRTVAQVRRESGAERLVRRWTVYSFHQADERDRVWDIWAVPLSGDRKPFPVVQSPSNETHAQFSPDGRWIVYASNESGKMEIYAQPFRGNQPTSTGTRERVQITNGGGAQPRWRKDGRELYYLSPDNRLMAVSMEFKPKFEARNPKPLFQVRGARPFGDPLYDYDVSPNGQHFLFNLSGEGTVSPITVVVNWDLDLR